eukprot:TRINITY_DN10241_c0_g2_i1.p1 TRINITY_DN10241_c0_g2~~TRINITY_DN10241_c0_g2_i1.p1  ORF type:complete len:488 (+),score=117.68 TRINITY_DN10241_c0_g2_i1:75-1466(+)
MRRAAAALGALGAAAAGPAPTWREDFSDPGVLGRGGWQLTSTMSGGGNGEFEVYTGDTGNVYVSDGKLFLRPGLTEVQTNANSVTGAPLGVQGVLGCGRTDPKQAKLVPGPNKDACTNWNDHGQLVLPNCTDTGKSVGNPYGCAQSSGEHYTAVIDNKTTSVFTMLPPVTSGRVATHAAGDKARNLTSPRTFQYGRLEVRARIPSGDWLWPAIWMLPADMAYGPWPRSGEIDILESRGNDRKCTVLGLPGRDGFGSTLHWGYDFHPGYNAYNRTHTSYVVPEAGEDLAADFHTYGLRWNEQGLYTYMDDDENRVLEVNFDRPFWQRATETVTHCFQKTGTFEGCSNTETIGPAHWDPAKNPWGADAPNARPFDKPFYLVLNVAVGGVGGLGGSYFPDGWCSKPWTDHTPGRNSVQGAGSFYAAKDQWWPTWGGGSDGRGSEASSLVVDSIEYWDEAASGPIRL